MFLAKIFLVVVRELFDRAKLELQVYLIFKLIAHKQDISPSRVNKVEFYFGVFCKVPLNSCETIPPHVCANITIIPS